MPDHRVGMGIASQQRSIAMEHGNRGAVSEHDRCKEVLKIRRIHPPRHHAEENPAEPIQPMRDHRGRLTREIALNRLPQRKLQFAV